MTEAKLDAVLSRWLDAMPSTPEELARVEREVARRKQLDDEHSRRSNLRHADPRLDDADLEAIARGKLEDSKYLVATRKWHQDRVRPLLILAGGVGAGKSVVAGWALAETRGVYAAATDVARWWADKFNRFEHDRLRVLGAGLSVVDDVGTEVDRDHMQQALFDIVDRRQSLARRTIITTNLSKAELVKRYPDDRIWDRVRRMCTYVSSDSESMRARGGK